MYTIYIHKRKTDNVIFYVGIGNTVRSKVKTGRSQFWRNEVSKHGYTVEILSKNLTWENAQESEIRLIKLYGRRDLGLGTLVNLTDGGDGAPGVIPSKETRNKISESMKGKNKGENNPMFGKNPYEGKIHYRSKSIIDLKSGKIYHNIKDVLSIINTPKTTFLRWLENPKLNKTSYRLYEN